MLSITVSLTLSDSGEEVPRLSRNNSWNPCYVVSHQFLPALRLCHTEWLLSRPTDVPLEYNSIAPHNQYHQLLRCAMTFAVSR